MPKRLDLFLDKHYRLNFNNEIQPIVLYAKL